MHCATASLANVLIATIPPTVMAVVEAKALLKRDRVGAMVFTPVADFLSFPPRYLVLMSRSASFAAILYSQNVLYGLLHYLGIYHQVLVVSLAFIVNLQILSQNTRFFVLFRRNRIPHLQVYCSCSDSQAERRNFDISVMADWMLIRYQVRQSHKHVHATANAGY